MNEVGSHAFDEVETEHRRSSLACKQCSHSQTYINININISNVSKRNELDVTIPVSIGMGMVTHEDVEH